MKKLKFLLSLVTAVSLISIMPLDIYANSFKVSDKSVESRDKDIDIKGVKPVIDGLTNKTFQTELNEQIDAQYSVFVKKSSSGTKKIVFSYKTVDSGDYFSILFYCVIQDAVSSQNYVSTIVVNTESEKIVSLNDIIGPNGVKLINKNFAASIAANPSKYNATFTGIEDNHNFYLDGETVHIPFDEFEIYVGSVGIIESTFLISEIKNFVIEKGDYRTKEVYGVKMIPLRLVAEEFGYTLNWNPSNSTVDILLNKNIITSVKIDSNSYTTSSTGGKRELESAPLLYDGRTYVPISFFEEILATSYAISPNGQITFSVYK